MKIALIYHSYPEHEIYAKITRDNHRKFAESHKYTFIESTGTPSYRHFQWEKWGQILKEVERNVEIDWFVWADPSVHYIRFDRGYEYIIQNVPDDKNFVFTYVSNKSNHRLSNLRGDPQKVAVSSPEFNDVLWGQLFLIRNKPESLDFIKTFYNDERFRRIDWIRESRFRDDIGLNIYYLGYPEWRKYFHIIDLEYFWIGPEVWQKTRGGCDFLQSIVSERIKYTDDMKPFLGTCYCNMSPKDILTLTLIHQEEELKNRDENISS